MRCSAPPGSATSASISRTASGRWQGVASTTLLRETLARVRAAGFELVNADLTLLAEAPRLAPHRDAIRRHLATELGVAIERVNDKATSTERLGFLGRGEGIAAQATVLVEARA